MQALQPQLKALQAKYKDDPQKFTAKQWEFYKKNKVNPLSGCLPALKLGKRFKPGFSRSVWHDGLGADLHRGIADNEEGGEALGGRVFCNGMVKKEGRRNEDEESFERHCVSSRGIEYCGRRGV